MHPFISFLFLSFLYKPKSPELPLLSHLTQLVEENNINGWVWHSQNMSRYIISSGFAPGSPPDGGTPHPRGAGGCEKLYPWRSITPLMHLPQNTPRDKCLLRVYKIHLDCLNEFTWTLKYVSCDQSETKIVPTVSEIRKTNGLSFSAPWHGLSWWG